MVSCLFGVLRTHAQDEGLAQATQIIVQLLGQKDPALNSALCENGASFLIDWDAKQGGSRERTNQNGAKENAAGIEAFLAQLLAVLSHEGSPAESARKIRVQLGSALASCQALNSSLRATLAPILGSMLQSERSRPLRDEITKAVEANKKHAQ